MKTRESSIRPIAIPTRHGTGPTAGKCGGAASVAGGVVQSSRTKGSRRLPAGAAWGADSTKRDPGLARLEAVLFLANEPLNSRKLSQYANLADGTEARTLVGRLNQLYDQAGRAFRVVELAGGMQLLTRPKFAAWLRRLQHIPPEVRFRRQPWRRSRWSLIVSRY